MEDYWTSLYVALAFPIRNRGDVIIQKCHPLSCPQGFPRSLQDHIKNLLSNLDDSAPTALRIGLINAHTKLSDYYTYFDQSPYYIWSCCEFAYS